MRPITFVTTLAAAAACGACAMWQQISDEARMLYRDHVELAPELPHSLARFSGDGNIWLYPDSTCHGPGVPRAGILVARHHVSIGRAGLNGQQRGVRGEAAPGVPSAEVRLSAGRPVTLRFHAGWREGNLEYGCRMFRTFVVEPQAEYEVTGLRLSVPTRACLVVVTRLDRGAPEPVPTSEAPRCGD